MLLGAYDPSWDDALHVLPYQCLVVSALAIALFAYARQKHRPKRVAVTLCVGLLAGLAAGIGWDWWNGMGGKSLSGLSGTALFERDMIAFITLGWSALATSAGLLGGWIGLEVSALVWRKRPREAAQAAKPAAVPDRGRR